MPGDLKACEAYIRGKIEEAEELFMPHEITTVLELLMQEREAKEWFAPAQPLYVADNPA